MSGFVLLVDEVKKLSVTYLDPNVLKPRLKNPRTHTRKQIKQIATSIEKFGFIKPVLIDQEKMIVAGHGTTEAAKTLGLTKIPTVAVDHLTAAQVRAYVIADNKIAQNAGWDNDLLAMELKELSLDPNIDVTITGFETAEIDLLISVLNEDGVADDSEMPAIDRTKPAVSRSGDLWKIGTHYLYCGNSLEAESYERLLGTKKAHPSAGDNTSCWKRSHLPNKASCAWKAGSSGETV